MTGVVSHSIANPVQMWLNSVSDKATLQNPYLHIQAVIHIKSNLKTRISSLDPSSLFQKQIFLEHNSCLLTSSTAFLAETNCSNQMTLSQTFNSRPTQREKVNCLWYHWFKRIAWHFGKKIAYFPRVRWEDWIKSHLCPFDITLQARYILLPSYTARLNAFPIFSFHAKRS